MDIAFFMYATYPRVKNSIKLIQILKLIIIFAKKPTKKSMDYDNQHYIYKYIYDKNRKVAK